MSKRKTICGALAVVSMLSGSIVPVMAEEDTKSTTLKYSVDESYEWQIHDAIDFGSDKGVNNTSTVTKTEGVKVTKNIISDGKQLVISLKNDNAFTVVNGNTSLSYTAMAGSTAVGAGDNVLVVSAGTNEASEDMTFTLSTGSGQSEVAGEYTGTIGYIATVETGGVTDLSVDIVAEVTNSGQGTGTDGSFRTGEDINYSVYVVNTSVVTVDCVITCESTDTEWNAKDLATSQKSETFTSLHNVSLEDAEAGKFVSNFTVVATSKDGRTVTKKVTLTVACEPIPVEPGPPSLTD